MGNFKEQGTEPTQSQKDANNLRRLTRTKQHNLRVVLILLTSPCGSQNLEKKSCLPSPISDVCQNC